MKCFNIVFTFIFVLAACGQQANNNDVYKTSNKNPTPDFSVALNFINEYTDYCNNMSPESIDTSWIDNNQYLTESFKSRYHYILDSAYRSDPELGLDFDPIFDAQDFPDQGFSILSTDSSTGYITVFGNNWESFTLTLKLVNLNNKWLVNGSGIVNIPNNRRAKR